MSDRAQLADPLQGPAPLGWWRQAVAAVRGDARDHTEGSIELALLLLAVPMVLELAMESLFSVAEVFWVSRLGPDAVAIVGITESMITLVYAAAIGLSIGATAVVARRIGEKDREGAARATVQVLALGLATATLICGTGVALAPHLLRVMGAPQPLVAEGGSFLRLVLAGTGTMIVLFLLNAVFRGAGEPAVAMRTLWLSNGLNILLGPCFIFGLGPFPKLGLLGAAVATNIGRGVGVLYQLWVLGRGRTVLRLRRACFRVDLPVLLGIARISRAGILQTIVGMTSWIGLVRILAPFGSGPLAGYTIAVRVMLFALLPSWGLANAAATLVGQNLGAGKPARAAASVWRAAGLNAGLLAAVGVVLLAVANPLVGTFAADAEAQSAGVWCLRLIAVGLGASGYGMVITQAFNGAGDTVTPTLLSLGSLWLLEIPLAYLLAGPLGLGPRGVFAAIPVGAVALAVGGVVAFRRGRWRFHSV
jgi:putative MATE family efflux protein